MEDPMLRLAIFALAIGFSACELRDGDMSDPASWSHYAVCKFPRARAAALTRDPGAAPLAPLAQTRSVLLITGVTIPKAWFDPITARLQRDGFRTFVYEPPSLLSGDLFENSERLGAVVDGIRAQTGEAKIDILAECTGGL